MSAQLSLLDNSPVARVRDPNTSRKAAQVVSMNGTRAIQQMQVLEAVRNHQGRTSAELAHACGWDRVMPARRLPELRNAGLVRNGEARKCDVTGMQSMTWWKA